MSEVRVRMAPSPSGFLHVGTARTTIYNWLFARHHKGKFILRIEDTDPSRSSPEMIDAILESIKWLGLDWDEGPYYQSQRTELYQQYAQKLLQKGKGYWCFCTPEELEEKRKKALAAKAEVKYNRTCLRLSETERDGKIKQGIPKAIRLFVSEGETLFSDLVYGELRKNNQELDDLIILRSDGTPTYNFACVVDDIDMRISHVIRGNDHIANTFKQVLIYQALGLTAPEFVHIPLILGKDKAKISKRHGAVSVMEYKEQGFLREAFVNFLALLGWSPKDDREILSPDQMIELFTLEGVNPSNPIFDKEKLEWMNGEYIRATEDEKLLELVIPFLVKENLITGETAKQKREWLLKYISLFKVRAKTLKEFAEKGKYFFKFDYKYEEKAAKKHFDSPEAADRLRAYRDRLSALDSFQKPEIEGALRGLAEEMGIKPATLIHPVRLATTGTSAGPPLFDLLELLGREEVTSRIRKAVEFVRAKLE
ncbi:MAG: glutamate--tRNA ligase [candidate division Zixibacteria bacterium]|nr:glutamate--tRNA ligase [candidate division Zixibacteria bacterium]